MSKHLMSAIAPISLFCGAALAMPSFEADYDSDQSRNQNETETDKDDPVVAALPSRPYTNRPATREQPRL